MGKCAEVAILDAGSQFGKVIDRRIRELNVCSEFYPIESPASVLKEAGCRCIIVSGSPASVHHEKSPQVDPDIFNLGVPVLGICYGMQLINQMFGGSVETSHAREDGQFNSQLDLTCRLFESLDDPMQTVLLTHGDSVKKVAEGFKVVGRYGKELITAIANESKQIYGVQFHPEVDLTINGKKMMETFLYKISGLKPTFTVESRESQCIKEIRDQVGNMKVLLLVSGGVDSSVLAALCYKALGPKQVVALHVDNGFMRKNESAEVVNGLNQLGVKVKLFQAANVFYNASTTISMKHAKGKERKVITRVLCQSLEPEEKRKIVGNTFMSIVDMEAQNLGLTIDDCILAQGTLRPDLIESASALASTNAEAIKTHHNDTDLVRVLRARGRVLEPLKDFHKDEVRAMGRRLNLPEDILTRHPFPGPGLAIRVICAEEPFLCADFSHTQTMLRLIAGYNTAINKPHALLQKIHAVLSNEDREKLRVFTERFPVKATLLPIKSVGVQGDGRTYSYVVGLSSNVASPDWDVVFFLAKTIPRICHLVNRVTYIFGEMVTGAITDITPTVLSFNVLSTLRQCDFLAHEVLKKYNVMKNISQMPVVLLPIHFDRDTILTRESSCQRSVVLRPFVTNDFMTGLAARPNDHLPETVVFEMAKEVKKVSGISRVLYDLTSKPPGTTEWE